MGSVTDAMRSRTDTTTQRELSAAAKSPADGPDYGAGHASMETNQEHGQEAQAADHGVTARDP